VLLAALLAACAPAPRPVPPPAPAPPPPAAVVPPPACGRIVRIEVRKAERALVAFCEGGAVHAMPAAMGREPLGRKASSGDERTPEGAYRVAGPMRPSRFHGFIPIDYPSRADADAALAGGRIGRSEHARIAEAHARGAQPPADTPLGGDIGIHGEGARWAGDSQHLDWTYGCVAVSDADLDFLAPRLAVGVPVEILP
jgi:murein L,D-transpeptidase YafK